MNKAELISEIATKTGLKKGDIAKVLDAEQDVIAEALSQGDKVQLVGFATFEPVPRSARKGFNPITKEEIQIEARVGVKVSAGSRLENAVQDLDVNELAKAIEAEKAARKAKSSN